MSFLSLKSLFGARKQGASQGVHRWPDGLIDCHSHILPGVDDGVQRLDESLKILARMESMGWRKLWLTPHIMEDVPNTPDELRSRFGELSDAYDGGIELHLAAENMLDGLFEERLEAGEILTLDNNLLLVETSYFDGPANLIELLERIFDKGYTPLLAHPERYNYMERADYDRLHAMGVQFQLNAMSLSGHYGPVVRAKAKDLMQAHYYHRVGSDLHHAGHLEVLGRTSVPQSF